MSNLNKGSPQQADGVFNRNSLRSYKFVPSAGRGIKPVLAPRIGNIKDYFHISLALRR